jgi:MYXO-CTERM domain-containing protein
MRTALVFLALAGLAACGDAADLAELERLAPRVVSGEVVLVERGRAPALVTLVVDRTERGPPEEAVTFAVGADEPWSVGDRRRVFLAPALAPPGLASLGSRDEREGGAPERAPDPRVLFGSAAAGLVALALALVRRRRRA